MKRKRSWLEKVAFSASGVHYTWGYVVFLLIPALVILTIIIAMVFIKNKN